MRAFLTASLAVLTLSAGLVLASQTPAKKTPATPPAATRKAPPPAQPTAAEAAAAITMPPVPNPGYAPARPVDQARAVFVFAARHPEVLKYVPCYCGCENDGHPHNESCFVKRRDAKGNVLEWDIHGYG